MGVVAEFFLLKALEGVLHHWWKLSITASVFVETSTHTYSLSEEGFGYNYGRLKSSASHASPENTLLRCGKIRNEFGVRRLQRQSSMSAASDALCHRLTAYSKTVALLRVSIY